MNIDLIAMPICRGSGRKGAELGPDVLLDAGVEQWLSPHQVHRKYVHVSPRKISSSEDVAANIREIAREVAPLRETVADSLRKGHLPVILGGDHSLTWGSLAATLDVYEDAWCVYIDAHGDINTPEQSPSGHVHGMHLSFLTGIRPAVKEAPEYMHKNIPCERFKFMATRSLDECERSEAQRFGLDITSSAEIRERGIEDVVEDLRHWLENSSVEKVHLSFDIDAVDPLYAPGTGVPVPHGLKPEEAQALIEAIMSSGRVVTIDMVEFNPLLDRQGATLEVWHKLFGSVSRALL